jgi:DDE_Tnp_1-associated
MSCTGAASFEQHFHDLQDPRVERTRKHPLLNIVFMAVCGILSGANSIAGIHEFAIDRRSWFARYPVDSRWVCSSARRVAARGLRSSA